MANKDAGQDEIERLLAEAQKANAGGGSEPRAPSSTEETSSVATPPSQSATRDQRELDAVLASAATTSPPPSSGPASAASADDAASSAVSQNDIELLLNQAEQAIASIESPVELPPGVTPFQLDDFGGTPASTEAASLELVRDVQLDLKIELGRTHMHLEDVLRLQQGAVVPLDKLAGDPVDLYVNGRMIARGEVLVLNDNFCVRVTELIVGDSACA